MPKSLVESIAAIVEPNNVQRDVNMAECSQWRVGGKLDLLVRPTTKHQIATLQKLFLKNNIPYFIFGSTTNLLFCDEDIHAVGIQIGQNFSTIGINNNKITAQSGIWVPKLARLAMQASLSGLEHTCGIPGTLGGLIVMNGGSQRKGIGDVVTKVETINEHGDIKIYNNSDCKFEYRKSIFQSNKETIVEVELQLPLDDNNDKKNIRNEMLNILRSRNKKFPRKMPNCGSIFVSNPAMYEQYGPPGKIIEACGLKGSTIGGAQVSEHHANFIVNKGVATASNILDLINRVRNTVFESTGYLMKVEPKFLTNNGMIRPI